jgi:hypothetical protein
MVIQYNKCDLPGVMSVEEMNPRLNEKGRPFFRASATMGNGVFDTLKLIIKLVLERAKATGQGQTAPKPAVQQPSPVEKPYPEMASSQGTAPEPVSAPTATAVQEEPSPSEDRAEPATADITRPREEVSRETAFRPYPGSDKAMSERKVATAPRPQSDELPAEALGRNVGAESQESSRQPSAVSSPQMAPSLRRRKEKKKRGFFKRLFGIK